MKDGVLVEDPVADETPSAVVQEEPLTEPVASPVLETATETVATPEKEPAATSPVVRVPDHDAETEEEQTQPGKRTEPETRTEPTPPVAEPVQEPQETVSPTPAVEAEKSEESEEQARKETVPAEPVTPISKAELPSPSSDGSRYAALDADMNWSSCGPILGGRTDPFQGSADPGIDHIEADSTELDRKSNLATFTGNVVYRSGQEQWEADRIIYNSETKVLDAQGQVLLKRPGLRLLGDQAHYQMTEKTGEMTQTEYRLVQGNVRGTAARAQLAGPGYTNYQDLTYTSCRPGNEDWFIRAEQLDLDHVEGFGTVSNATLNFFGAPVLYLPTLTFPIDNRRRTGLLIPTFGHSDNTGFDLSLPYYLNLAPNYDATITPRLMSEHGLMLGGEFRFLSESSNGEIRAEYLQEDQKSSSLHGGDQRGAFAFKGDARLAPDWTGDVILNHVSDNEYLEDFGSSLAISSTRHLERRADVRYQGDDWNLLGRLQDYQTIDNASSSPYRRLPQVLATLNQIDGPSQSVFDGHAEYVYFDHETRVRGHRVDLNPGISLPIRNAWSFMEPRLSLRYTAYDLDSQTIGLDSSPDRFTGTFSFDSGLYFDRDSQWFGDQATQTLEPRLYYLYTPEVDQTDIPLFDTSQLDSSYGNLFRDNRFSGPDRVGDANQVTLALTSRTLSSRGHEWFRATLGEIFYFSDRDVTLTNTPNETDDVSDFIANLQVRPNEYWLGRAGLVFDPNPGDGRVDQFHLQTSYRDGNRRLFNATYRNRYDSVDQVDIAGRWPVAANTQLVGRWDYSIRDAYTLEAFAGIEYGECCWRIRAIARQYQDSPDHDTNLSVMLQLELKGLGQFGDDIDSLFERGIYGYRKDEEEY